MVISTVQQVLHTIQIKYEENKYEENYNATYLCHHDSDFPSMFRNRRK